MGEQQYKIRPVLCTDMVCLVEMLNLTEVHHPKATVKCCFCDCDKNSISDFTRERWPRRNETKWQEREEQVPEYEDARWWRSTRTDYVHIPRPSARQVTLLARGRSMQRSLVASWAGG